MEIKQKFKWHCRRDFDLNPACETVATRKLSDPKSLVEFKQNSRSETFPLYFLAILISLRIGFLYFIEVFFCVIYSQVLWRDLSYSLFTLHGRIGNNGFWFLRGHGVVQCENIIRMQYQGLQQSHPQNVRMA